MAILAAASLSAGGALAWLLVRWADCSPETLSRAARWGAITAPVRPAFTGKDYLNAAATDLAARISRPSFFRVFLTNVTIAALLAFALPMLAHVATRKGWDPRRHAVVMRACVLTLPIAGMMIQLSRGAFLLSCARLSQSTLSPRLFLYGPIEITALLVLVSLPYGYYRDYARPALTNADGSLKLSYPAFLRHHRWIAGSCVAAIALAALFETVLPRW